MIELLRSPQESHPKRLKKDDEDGEQRIPRDGRFKIAIFFGYCGAGYQGMRNGPETKTIDADLQEALFLSVAVPRADRGQPKRFDWSRSARTDKNVSSVCQVVSGLFYIDPPGLVHRLNSNLPPQIRVFGYKRVTEAFNAESFFDSQRCVYLIPVFALNPLVHRYTTRSDIEDEGPPKCLECWQRGGKDSNKDAGSVGEESSASSNIVGSGILSHSGPAVTYSRVKEATGVSLSFKITVPAKYMSGDGLHSESTIRKAKVNVEFDLCDEKVENPATAGGFCYGEKERERFNRI